MEQSKTNKIILVTGACGQIGTELVKFLRQVNGSECVIASDIKPETYDLLKEGQYKFLDVLDIVSLEKIVKNCGVTHIYHLAAILSANGEQRPLQTWDVNMTSLLNVLEVARLNNVEQVFWPSSIAVFGQASPKNNCSQLAIHDPSTVYGISKSAGEYWCRYYYEQYGLDIRSLRYPGLISHSAEAGGGTTDYVVAIFHKAITEGAYECFLNEHTNLPMMYMEDALRATVELMEASLEGISKITSYNIAGMSFTPFELATEISTYIDDFLITYKPDHRQRIADSWPYIIDDNQAKQDWGWTPQYNISTMTVDMIDKLNRIYSTRANENRSQLNIASNKLESS